MFKMGRPQQGTDRVRGVRATHLEDVSAGKPHMARCLLICALLDNGIIFTLPKNMMPDPELGAC